MASGHVNRIKRPNTWLQRPMLQNREESSCQTGAVHTWHFSDVLRQSFDVRCWGLNRPKSAAPEGRLLTHKRHSALNWPGRFALHPAMEKRVQPVPRAAPNFGQDRVSPAITAHMSATKCYAPPCPSGGVSLVVRRGCDRAAGSKATGDDPGR